MWRQKGEEFIGETSKVKDLDGGGYALIHPHGQNTYGTQTLMRTTRAGIVSQ